LAKVTDPERGVVKSSNYYSGWLAMNISTRLRNFPFDFHDLKIILRPHKHDKSKLRMLAWKGMAAIDTAMHVREMNEWELVGHRSQAKETDMSVSTTGKTYSLFEIDIMVQRSHMWYTLNVVCYMSVMVYLSFATYLLPVSEIGSRWEGTLAMLLVVMATKFPISDVIPRVWYFILFDHSTSTHYVCSL
jgi:hypothetical protein